eukprot:756341-Hanusia_phi.AAC.2
MDPIPFFFPSTTGGGFGGITCGITRSYHWDPPGRKKDGSLLKGSPGHPGGWVKLYRVPYQVGPRLDPTIPGH